MQAETEARAEAEVQTGTEAQAEAEVQTETEMHTKQKFFRPSKNAST